MGLRRRTSRKQRLLRSALLAISLAGFAYSFLQAPPDFPDAGFGQAVGWACAGGAVLAIGWFGFIMRLPDDQLRCWEPDPKSDPATRGLRLTAFSGLAIAGVAAVVGAIGGYGFDGAVWWRSLLVCFAWPMLLAGVIGFILTRRERILPAIPIHASRSDGKHEQ